MAASSAEPQGRLSIGAMVSPSRTMAATSRLNVRYGSRTLGSLRVTRDFISLHSRAGGDATSRSGRGMSGVTDRVRLDF